MTFKNTVYAALLALLTGLGANAYDFTVANNDGRLIYYDIIQGSSVAVTAARRSIPTNSYTGNLAVPSAVMYGGKTYDVSAIRPFAFSNCTALTSVSLPASVTQVPASAFDGCYNMTSINVGVSSYFRSIDGVLFSADGTTLIAMPPGKEGHYTLPPTTTKIADRALGSCHFISGTSLPASLSVILDYAFYYCGWLQDLHIPASVEEIGHNAFADCGSLRSITVDLDNAEYASADGALYDKDITTLLQYPGAAPDFGALPSTVRAIADGAMFRNMGVTTVILPEGVVEIGRNAFADAQSLTAVSLPSSISQIGSMAFGVCPNLQAIYLSVSDPADISLGENVFVGLDPDKCVLYVPAGARIAYKTADQWGHFKNIRECGMLSEQTITWDSAHNPADEAVVLTATSSSGLPVFYRISEASDGVATICGDVLTSVAPGAVQVTAYQPGDPYHAPAAPVTRTFFKGGAGIDDIENDADGVRVYGAYGNIVVEGAAPAAVAYVYTTQGSLVYTGPRRFIPVSGGGIYIVRIHGKSHKIAVR